MKMYTFTNTKRELLAQIMLNNDEEAFDMCDYLSTLYDCIIFINPDHSIAKLPKETNNRADPFLLILF